MAAISSNGTGGGLASAATSWAGGVVPTALDDVTVLAGDTINISGVVEWNSVTALGTVLYSRIVSTSLQLNAKTGFIPSGTIDMGTLASPIPLGLTATLILAAVGAAQYVINEGGMLSSHGAYKKRTGMVTAIDPLLPLTTFTVDDTTGWLVGDTIVGDHVGQQRSNNIYNGLIQSITPTTGTASIIVVATAAVVGFEFYVGQYICNMTSNVVIQALDKSGADEANKPYMEVWRRNQTTSANRFHAVNTEFAGLAQAGKYPYHTRSAWGDKYQNTYNLIIEGCSFHNCGGAVGIDIKCFVKNCSIVNYNYASNNLGNLTALFCKVEGTIEDTTILNYYHAGYYTMFSAGRILNCRDLLGVVSGIKVTEASMVRGMYELGDIANSVDYTFRNCTITNMSRYVETYTVGAAHFIRCNLDKLTVQINGAPDQPVYAIIADNGGVPTAQYKQWKNGVISRDNTIASTATPVASIKFESLLTSYSLKYETKAVVLSGQALSISCDFRHSAAYSGTFMPRLRVVLGGVEYLGTSGVPADTWQTISINTAPALASSVATIIVESIGKNAVAWVDNLTIGGKVFDIGQDLWGGLGTEVSNVIDITDTLRHLTVSNAPVGTEIRIYDKTGASVGSFGSEILLDANGLAVGVESFAGGLWSYDYNYSGNTPVKLQAMAPNYVEESYDLTLLNSNQNIQLRLNKENN